MNRDKIILIGSIIVNVVLVFSVLSNSSKITELEGMIEASIENTSVDPIKTTDEYVTREEFNLYKTEGQGEVNLEKSIQFFGLQQTVTLLEHTVNRLERLIIRLDDVSIVYGQLQSINNNGRNTIKVKKKDSDNEITLTLDDNCEAYFISEIGLVKGSIQDFITMSEFVIGDKNMSEFTFIIMNNKVVQIYQGIIDFKN